MAGTTAAIDFRLARGRPCGQSTGTGWSRHTPRWITTNAACGTVSNPRCAPCPASSSTPTPRAGPRRHSSPSRAGTARRSGSNSRRAGSTPRGKLLCAGVRGTSVSATRARSGSALLPIRPRRRSTDLLDDAARPPPALTPPRGSSAAVGARHTVQSDGSRTEVTPDYAGGDMRRIVSSLVTLGTGLALASAAQAAPARPGHGLPAHRRWGAFTRAVTTAGRRSAGAGGSWGSLATVQASTAPDPSPSGSDVWGRGHLGRGHACLRCHDQRGRLLLGIERPGQLGDGTTNTRYVPALVRNRWAGGKSGHRGISAHLRPPDDRPRPVLGWNH